MTPFSLNTNDVIFLLAAVILIFLIIREVLCWYWKINDRVALMEKMVSLQSETAKLQAETGNLLVNIHTESQKNNKLLQDMVLKLTKNENIAVVNHKTDNDPSSESLSNI